MFVGCVTSSVAIIALHNGALRLVHNTRYSVAQLRITNYGALRLAPNTPYILWLIWFIYLSRIKTTYTVQGIEIARRNVESATNEFL